MVSIVGLWFERGTSVLRLYNVSKFTVAVGVKNLSNICSACTLLFNVNNYTVISGLKNFLQLTTTHSLESQNILTIT